MPPTHAPAPASPPTPRKRAAPPSLLALWWVNFLVGATGFGGSIMWLRREMVERRGWLTAEEFNAGLSIAQFMPGPNVFNFMAAVARHQRGAAGVVVSAVAIMAAPLVLVMILGTLYAQYGDLPAARAAMRGIAPVAAGIMLSFGLKTASSPALRSPIVLVAILTFGVVVWFRLSLPMVMLTMAPLGILIAARRIR